VIPGSSFVSGQSFVYQFPQLVVFNVPLYVLQFLTFFNALDALHDAVSFPISFLNLILISPGIPGSRNSFVDLLRRVSPV